MCHVSHTQSLIAMMLHPGPQSITSHVRSIGFVVDLGYDRAIYCILCASKQFRQSTKTLTQSPGYTYIRLHVCVYICICTCFILFAKQTATILRLTCCRPEIQNLYQRTNMQHHYCIHLSCHTIYPHTHRWFANESSLIAPRSGDSGLRPVHSVIGFVR